VELTGTETGQLLIAYDEGEFEKLFKSHFKALHAYATVMLHDEVVAEEIVQNMFLKLWEKRDRLSIQSSVKAYLYKCVHNDSLNYIKHLKVKANYEDHTTYIMKDQTNQPAKTLELKELESRLWQALNELPEQCRTIFQMSRFEELKYKEIAERLGLSIKTVENQMGKALKLLRIKLVDFLPLILILFMPNRFN
jgi:RNA polymerase sigma-70 factor (ECF subfamily)